MCASPLLPSVVDFGREVCGDLAAAEAREWVVTNGIGGFACGTVAGTLTRRYHGLLVATLRPPLDRTLLVSKIDEVVEYRGETYALGANRWAGGVISPQGYVYIERFRLEGTTPVWTLAFADALMEKRVWMAQGANTTYVQYTVTRAGAPVKLAAKVLVNYRAYHCLTRDPAWFMNVQSVDHGRRLQAFAEAVPIYLLSHDAKVEPAHTWYRNYELAAELLRGLDYEEDHLHAATFRIELGMGKSATLVAGTDPVADLDGASALKAHTERQITLLDQSAQAHSNWPQWPAWVKQLVLAADQFIVARPVEEPQTLVSRPAGPRAEAPEGFSIIAGYPWFGDWGRDTMIALPCAGQTGEV